MPSAPVCPDTTQGRVGLGLAVGIAPYYRFFFPPNACDLVVLGDVHAAGVWQGLDGGPVI